MKKILLPVDFSPCSSAALSYALILGERFASDIDVLHVWEPPRDTIDRDLATLGIFEASETGQRMKDWLQRMEEGRHRQTRARLASGDPASRIVEIARDFDLIVMGTHGRQGVQRLLYGSVTQAVVSRAPCPVLVVRAEDDVRAGMTDASPMGASA